MIRCLALDDEPLALDILEDNIKQIPFLQLMKRCRNIFEAMEALQTGTIDLLFLDIEMPGMDGTNFLRTLSARPMVIFITAYKQYALEGFDLDVLDYLVKPVAFDRFVKAANKALEYHTARVRENNALPAGAAAQVADHLFVNTEYRLVKVLLDEITHIEALNNYVRIHLTGSKPVLSRSSLKTFEERLPAGRYVRVHKSFLIAIDKITSIERECVRIGEAEIPVSRSFREELLKRIGNKI